MGSNGFSAHAWLSHWGHWTCWFLLSYFLCVPTFNHREASLCSLLFFWALLFYFLLFCPLPRSLFLPPNMHFITFFPLNFFFTLESSFFSFLGWHCSPWNAFQWGPKPKLAVPQLKLSRECVLPNLTTRGCARNICGIFPAEQPLSGWLCCRKEKGARGPGLAIHKIQRGLAQKMWEYRATG